MTLCYIIMLSGHHPKTIPNGWNKLQTGGLSSRRRSTLSQDDVLGKITRRWWEVLRRVMEGTLNPDAVATAFQQIAEGTQDMLPTEMTVGNRTYKILGFLRGDEKSVIDHTMVERAKEMNANLGEDDGQFLLDNQQDIPVALGGARSSSSLRTGMSRTTLVLWPVSAGVTTAGFSTGAGSTTAGVATVGCCVANRALRCLAPKDSQVLMSLYDSHPRTDSQKTELVRGIFLYIIFECY